MIFFNSRESTAKLIMIISLNLAEKRFAPRLRSAVAAAEVPRGETARCDSRRPLVGAAGDALVPGLLLVAMMSPFASGSDGRHTLSDEYQEVRALIAVGIRRVITHL